MRRAWPYTKLEGLNGARGLLVAVVAQATADLAAGDPTAAAYFMSEQYRGHLTWLDLPAEWLPDGVTAADVASLSESAAGVASTLA